MTKRTRTGATIGTGLALGMLLGLGPASGTHAESRRGPQLHEGPRLHRGLEATGKKNVKGYALIEAIDRSAGTVQILGQTYRVTQKTQLQNEYGMSARLDSFEAAQRMGLLTDSSTGSAVYFEIGKDGTLAVMRLVKAIPS